MQRNRLFWQAGHARQALSAGSFHLPDCRPSCWAQCSSLFLIEQEKRDTVKSRMRSAKIWMRWSRHGRYAESVKIAIWPLNHRHHQLPSPPSPITSTSVWANATIHRTPETSSSRPSHQCSTGTKYRACMPAGRAGRTRARRQLLGSEDFDMRLKRVIHVTLLRTMRQ
ncbi:hypothetical protein CC85DRAFT_71369 [Cutaneotrichosporon oleaginosum]|uniref:Uncharacterized protein n=1 Tax=Cutaneotrichosporon oleaginosum TaxID=879819 RepID=A0A0J0XP64_9TREE|nr:uncharacterized protein CC85DRAFT_71369 [Cutaneotrichosporon oleaginosum]KLT42872.1 hypothetical protein CC85DRAFT_71369 [Cutaneotrichosporon oleaginosum]TXT12578.1 hypothetical protein COLE_02988 [Cutaneotrichosporon oleaginosum]